MKLIDVDRFVEDFGHHHTESMSPYMDREKLRAFNDGIDFIVDMLRDEPEVTAHWVHKYPFVYECSGCDQDFIVEATFHKHTVAPPWNYCPNCGARMVSK